jgi:hypothetical protein
MCQLRLVLKEYNPWQLTWAWQYLPFHQPNTKSTQLMDLLDIQKDYFIPLDCVFY